MRKLLLAAALLCGLALASCNKELGPEYKTPPQIGDVTFVPAAVQPDQAVAVSAPVTCPYGLDAIYIVYWLDDNMEAAEMDGLRRYTKEQTSVNYSGNIKEQKAGTKVSFIVVAVSPYNAMAVTKQFDYTVGDDEPKPIDPVEPIEPQGN